MNTEYLESTISLSLSLFGGFDVLQAGQPLSFATDPARALLAYLAVEVNQAHRREALATLLWPEDREQSARQNLSQTLTRVRQAIGDYGAETALFLVTRPTLQLNRAAAITVELLNFQQLLTTCAGHAHRDLTHCEACIERLTEAVERYRGPFLAGTHFVDSAPFEEWVLLTREQSQRQALDALHTLTLYHMGKRNYPRAQQYAARQLALEPWREAAHRQFMLALAHTGQRGAALAQYESCRRLLADELAVEPEAATVALAEEIRRGEVHDKMTGGQDDTAIGVSVNRGHPVIRSSSDTVGLPYGVGLKSPPNTEKPGYPLGAAAEKMFSSA